MRVVQGSAREEVPASEEQEEDAVWYYSASESVKTSGVHSWITQPLVPGHAGQAPLERTVQTALKQAEKCGITKPIAIGALPFDPAKKANLLIPRSYEFFARLNRRAPEALQDGAQALTCTSSPERASFKQAVARAVEACGAGRLDKVVLSRKLCWHCAEAVDPHQVVQRLLQQNPGGYLFNVPLQYGGRLVGASPELLLKKRGRSLQTWPLAGSARRAQDAELDQQVAKSLLHSAKDHYEHGLVVAAIKAQLQPYCTELSVPESPALVGTQTLWHLGSRIQGQLARPETSALTLAKAVHPTPAVCGYPTQAAQALLAELEPHDRGYYGGMVGWCDLEGNGEWALTIRCGIIQEKTVQLFAGAGIVKQSTPEREWQETQDKLQTMLRALPETFALVAAQG